jgi:transposase-like protein
VNDLLAAGLWESIADVARQKGITRQSLNERVDRLESDGLIEVRREGRAKLINVAQFDRVVGQVGDAFKEAGAETRAEAEIETSTASPALRDHQARAAQYTADLKFLDLEERLGRLVPIDDFKSGGVKIGEAVVRILGRLPTYAEAVTAAAINDGVPATRAMLKQIERELRTAIAETVGEIIGAAVPSTIEPGEENEPA